MTNNVRRPVYIGITAHLRARIFQHREGTGSAYCKRYNLTRLVYVEEHSRIYDAIAREKAMKAWLRPWKDELIEKINPGWADLWDDINR